VCVCVCVCVSITQLWCPLSSVQMISAEAPVLFAKAAQIFITELTLRAWIHTEDNKRRTLQVRGRSLPARPVGPGFESGVRTLKTRTITLARTHMDAY